MDTVYECKQSSSEHWREAEPKLELALLLQSLDSPGTITIDGWDWRIQPESERDLTLVGEIGAKILQTLQEVKVNPSSHHIVVPVVAEGWIRTLAEEIYDITQEQQ